MKKIFLHIITIILIALICLCGYKLFEISEEYIEEEKIEKEVSAYSPKDDVAKDISETEGNQHIIDLQNEINKDIVGWINIPNTKIDYPFVIATDNDFYLRRDLHGKKAVAGTIFMDFRCNRDFTGFNNIIYGHNMKNSSMFSELELFADEDFFEANQFGTLFLKNNTYTLKFFAYMIVKSNDKVIYNTSVKQDELFKYVKKAAQNYREPIMEGNVVILSTCSYQASDARIILLADLILE